MILLAVIIGYILGITPFIIPKIIEIYKSRKEGETKTQESKEQAEIFDEWLNGPKDNPDYKENNSNKVNQEDIYKEYITGIATPKGD